MDQEAIIDQIQEEILNRLPDEAIEKISALPDDAENHDEKIGEIIAEYGVDAAEVAREVAEREDLNNGQ